MWRRNHKKREAPTHARIHTRAHPGLGLGLVYTRQYSRLLWWAPVTKRCISVHLARGRSRFVEQPRISRRRGRNRLSFRALPWGASFGVMKCGVVRGLGARGCWATCSPCLGLSQCSDVGSVFKPVASCGRRESPIRLRENKIHGWVVGRVPSPILVLSIPPGCSNGCRWRGRR